LLVILEKEFERENNEPAKVTELKQLEQGLKIIDEFVQIFRKVAKRSSYKEKALIEKFKKEININIRCKLIETKQSSLDIDNRVINLDRN